MGGNDSEVGEIVKDGYDKEVGEANMGIKEEKEGSISNVNNFLASTMSMMLMMITMSIMLIAMSDNGFEVSA